jgi:MFS family permease
MRQEVKTVPVHSLGLSQIISYGALFYVFAQIKIPLSEKIDLDLWITSLVITLSLFIHVINSAYVGLLVDKIGGLKVLSLGLFFGSAGMFGLGVSQDAYSFLLSMVLVGLSFSMSSYNVAFSTAIQLDDTNSRRNITIITFYGAVASSICWLSIGPIHSTFGLDVSFYFLSGLLFS